MAGKRGKTDRDVDVLVMGDHPCGYLAATLARAANLRVAHLPLPDTMPADRLVLLSPPLQKLNAFCEQVVDAVAGQPIFGLQFLADRAGTWGQYTSAAATGKVARFRDVRTAAAAAATAAGVDLLGHAPERIEAIDETGLTVWAGGRKLRAGMLVVGGPLPRKFSTALAIPDAWPPQVVHRFTTLRCRAGKHFRATQTPRMPMSLDLRDNLCWAWLMPGDGEFQLTVEQPVEGAGDGVSLLNHWVKVLQGHGVLGPKFVVDPAEVSGYDLPLAGALEQDGVGNRTLLIGPAGGFYTACGEDVFPGCWSAVFAVAVVKAALKARHLQDELNRYRENWRTTLGDYLRGPQENLRLLLPLVYRNTTMSGRLAEAILLGKNLVR